MSGGAQLAERFEAHRPRLRAVAYRMLGSLGEADDVVQETWLRLDRHAEEVENLGGWLTTVASRVCLNELRGRERRREEELDTSVPDPVLAAPERDDPAAQALLGDRVGLALQVVLGTLGPAERLAFVLHDLFGVPLEDIAPLLGKSPAAVRQLASRARRRVRERAPEPDRDPAAQRAAVGAFLAASREGDFAGLVAVLAPDAVLRADGGPALAELSKVIRGGTVIASSAQGFRHLAPYARLVLVNGTYGTLTVVDGEPRSVMSFTVVDGLIAGIDVLNDPVRLAALIPAFPAL
ncbi:MULTISPECIES: sigma-70 family RNA polymerase sigma factor [Kitasatospora]|uniref:Putative RNA polymerase ECF subfamily sigma factor n=1 Tax=Kitasatospora setae (strain ATCC 33774 / DSM 43861 / JCM 3304 / KCC A-0304 / NBRC 14216 / KM-6054) TaxID=452652 RepID=E4NH54_KITSK|nr:putative RNA polymerase ECF subfamily sigma factor [Kitasatospora setae KM-6054]